MVSGGKINIGRAFSKAAKGFNRFTHSDVGHALGDVATMGLDAAASGGGLRLVKGSAAAKAHMDRLRAMRGKTGAGFAKSLSRGLKQAKSFAKSDLGQASGRLGMAAINGMGFLSSVKKGVRGARNFARSDAGAAMGTLGNAAINAAARGNGMVPLGMGVRGRNGYRLPRTTGPVLGEGAFGGFLARGGAVRGINTDALSGDFLHRDINNVTGMMRGSGLLPLG